MKEIFEKRFKQAVNNLEEANIIHVQTNEGEIISSREYDDRYKLIPLKKHEEKKFDKPKFYAMVLGAALLVAYTVIISRRKK